VLDVTLPELDGTDVCRTIRRRSGVPILFLSSRDDEVDRIVGLEIGGDGYVTKPFSPRELVARVRALLRRGQADSAAPSKLLTHGRLTMSKSVTLAARVDADLDAELSRLATASGRTKSWLVNEALRSFVANEQQFLAAVEERKQALRDGRTVDHATVVAAFERFVTPKP
jgi:DNA-binding response OmpR family regulator